MFRADLPYARLMDIAIVADELQMLNLSYPISAHCCTCLRTRLHLLLLVVVVVVVVPLFQGPTASFSA